MRQFIKIGKEYLNAGNEAVLCSVIASTGSVPRGAGAHMLVGAEGRIAGTVGGGAVEYECEVRAAQVLQEKQSCREHYRLNQNKVQDLGMICGGEVDVQFTYIASGDQQIIEWLNACEQSLERGRVYIFGGGHVAQALVPALSAVDFPCVILEDRDEFCRPELFPQAAEVRKIENSHIADYVTITEDDYVCVMTRGHKDDTLVQMQILRTPARYIGVIGSRRKKAGVFATLKENGFTDEDLQRIVTPIGLDIGAETPAEIAVSITAQLIQERAKK